MITRLLLGLLLCISTLLGADGRVNLDWVPPVGIPMPPFGITNSHWMYHPDFSSATWDYGSGAVPYRTNEYGPYVYYVDNTHGSATDTANTYGTPTTPRLTWPFPLAAGAVVQVANGGNYTFNNGASSTMRHGGTGTSSQPVFIVGVGATTNAADRPKIDGKSALLQGTWSMLEGFVLTNNTTLATRNDLYAAPVVNVCVRSNLCVGTGAASSVTVFAVSSATTANYVDGMIVFRNYVANYGNYTNATENDACAVIFRDFSTNCWMLDNYVTRMGGDMIRVGSNEDNDLDNCNTGYHYVGRNVTHQNGENAVDIKKANRVVISENTCYDFQGYVPTGGDSAISCHYNPNHVWFINNVVHDGIQGFNTGSRMQQTNQVWVAGNVFYGFSDSAIYWRGTFTNHLYWNTVYDAENGVRITTSGNGPIMRQTNNIIVDSGTFNLTYPNSITRGTAEIGNDCYWNTGGGALISWASTHTTVADWLSAASTGDGTIEGDPGFVNAAGGNFALSAADGPCVGTGVDVGDEMEGAFLSQFGFALNYVDRAGNARNNDIGAYEFQNTTRRGSTHGSGRFFGGVVIAQ